MVKCAKHDTVSRSLDMTIAKVVILKVLYDCYLQILFSCFSCFILLKCDSRQIYEQIQTLYFLSHVMYANAQETLKLRRIFVIRMVGPFYMNERVFCQYKNHSYL